MNTRHQAKQAYRLKLASLMSLCDANYLLVMKLLANKHQVGEKREFALSEQLNYQLKVHEVTPYTSLVSFEQKEVSSAFAVSALSRPKMQIRLYHDAKMAEVISAQGVNRIQPKYTYPNEHMHQPDEKHQVNLFLKEWAQLCLHQGRITNTTHQILGDQN